LASAACAATPDARLTMPKSVAQATAARLRTGCEKDVACLEKIEKDMAIHPGYFSVRAASAIDAASH